MCCKIPQLWSFNGESFAALSHVISYQDTNERFFPSSSGVEHLKLVLVMSVMIQERNPEFAFEKLTLRNKGAGIFGA